MADSLGFILGPVLGLSVSQYFGPSAGNSAREAPTEPSLYHDRVVCVSVCLSLPLSVCPPPLPPTLWQYTPKTAKLKHASVNDCRSWGAGSRMPRPCACHPQNSVRRASRNHGEGVHPESMHCIRASRFLTWWIPVRSRGFIA